MRRPRFSLLSLMLFILLAGSGVALWMHYPAWRIEKRITVSAMIYGMTDDGRYLLCSDQHENRILFDSTGVELKRFELDLQRGHYVTFSPDNQCVQFAHSRYSSEHSIGLERWHIQSRQWLKSERKSRAKDASETLSQDGRWVLARRVSVEVSSIDFSVLDATTGAELRGGVFLFSDGPIVDFLQNPSGESVLLWAHNGRAEVLELPTLKVLASYPCSTGNKVSPDLRWIADYKHIEHALVVRETLTGRVQLKIPIPQGRNGFNFLPGDGSEIFVTVPEAQFAELWNIQNETQLKLEIPNKPVFGMYSDATIRGGRIYLRMLSRKSVLIWDRATGKNIFCGDVQVVSPDATRVIANRQLVVPPSTEPRASFPDDYYHFYFTDAPDRILAKKGSLDILRRYRPEAWWGIAWLPEFWSTIAFAALFVWNLRRARFSR